MTQRADTTWDRHLVTELCRVEEGLTQWEVEFVDRLGREMRAQGDRWQGLSSRQRTKAEQIADRLGVA